LVDSKPSTLCLPFATTAKVTASLDRYDKYRDEASAKPHETLLNINIPYLEA